MTTATRTGARDAPPLADVAVVHEDDNGWRLMRNGNAYYELRRLDERDDPESYFLAGWLKFDPVLHQWVATRNLWSALANVYIGNDSERALAALWAARGTL